MNHMQNVLYAEDLPKSNSLFAINDDDDYFDELDTEAEYSDLLLGTLATSYDLMGKWQFVYVVTKAILIYPIFKKY